MAGFKVSTGQFSAGIRRLARLNNKAQGEVLLGFAKTTLRNNQGTGIIDMTPPAAPGVTGFAAKRQGEAAVDRDLNRAFIGVTLKRKRPEKYPDPHAIHRRLFKGKRPGTPLRVDLPKGQKYNVAIAKLKALRRHLHSRVGRMASSWLPSAARLGVNVPNWIGRHGSGPGECKVNMNAPRYSVEMTAFPHVNTPVTELSRRVRIALNYTERRLERAIVGTLEANTKKAGFRT